MNYNSIEEILTSGITNMEVLRDNTKQDDGTDTIIGVNWFTFNGTVASTIYAGGNSFIGFGSNSEHLKINRRDGALWSLYREEGTLYNHYKFLKIRWVGYSYYSQTSTSHALTYDVILWDTGDISLHMISIPTSYNTGTYSLVAGPTTYTYTVSTSTPDITFIKTDSGFEVNNSIIELTPPPKIRYLIRSNSTYYTTTNNNLEEVSITELTSSVFLSFGIENIPSINLISSLSNPEILYWREVNTELEQGLVVQGVPQLPQIIHYEQQDISNYSGIEKAEVIASDDVTFAITFDNGQTWKYYSNDAWNIATTESEGMSATTIKNIPSSAWTEVATSTAFSFRCALPTVNSTVSNIYIKYI